MKLIPAIIFAAIALSFGTAYAQEPTETATVAPTATSTPEPTPLPDGRLTWELRGAGCVDVRQSRGPEDVHDFDLCGSKRLTLDEGLYRFTVRVQAGYELDSLSCSGDAREDDETVSIAVHPGDSLKCVVRLDEVAPTRTPTPTATSTPVVITRVVTATPTAVLPTATPFSVVAPVQVIQPPSTGDGGLR